MNDRRAQIDRAIASQRGTVAQWCSRYEAAREYDEQRTARGMLIEAQRVLAELELAKRMETPRDAMPSRDTAIFSGSNS